MARRAISPRHGLIMGLGPVTVTIFTPAGRRRKDIDDSYVLSRGLGDISMAYFLLAATDGTELGGSARPRASTLRDEPTIVGGCCWVDLRRQLA